MEQDNTIEIIDTPVDENVNNVTDELTDEEKALSERLGLSEEPKSGEKDTKTDDKPVVPEKTEKKEEGIKEEDYDTFEKVHDLYEHDKDKYYSLPRAVKNQYHNSKGLYKQLKEEQERRKKIEDDQGYDRLHESVSKAKIERLVKRITEAKGNPDLAGLTIEEIESILDHKAKEDDQDRPLTMRDMERIRKEEASSKDKQTEEQQAHNEFVRMKIQDVEAYAKNNISKITEGKYDDFNKVLTLAQELASTKPRYAKQVQDVLNGNDSVEDVVDVLVDIAKLNPKWGEEQASNKNNVERMEKNAQRQRTSASVTTGKGGRVVSYDDLTPEDAVRLTKEQFDKLPREVRRRILSSV